MRWYKNNKNQWQEIIRAVASEEHRTAQMVEKDTIQSMILLELSKCELPFVFKGGTSLSKAYGLIDRFSEDIDLSMSRKPTESERRRAKSEICKIGENLGLTLTNEKDIQSRYSYNKYVFEYESLFNDLPLEIIVETSFYQDAYPVEIRAVNSFVGEFCSKRKIILPISFEAMTVEMCVQSLERTFIDKIFAVCDYRLQNMEARDSRHLYDIAKLLPNVLITPELKGLIDEVRKDRMKMKNNPAAQPEHDIPEMLKEIISSRFFESDYNTITQRLLYENVSYEEAISKGIALVAEMDIFKS